MRVRGDGFLLLREGAPGTVGGRDGGTPGCPRTDRIWVDGEPRREKAFLAGGTVGAEAGGAENGQSGRQPAGALETAETEPQAGARYHPVLEAFQQGTWGSEKTSLGQRDGKQAGGSLRLGRSNRPEQTGDRKGQGACWLAQQSCGQMGRMAEAGLLETRTHRQRLQMGTLWKGALSTVSGGGASKRRGSNKMQKGWWWEPRGCRGHKG